MMTSGTACTRLSLLGGFSLVVDGRPVTLPMQAQRVLAYLSLADPDHPGQPRTGLAEHLWGDVPGARANASLRTALWRIRQASDGLVRVSRETVGLDERVEVDVRARAAQAHRLLADGPGLRPSDDDIRGLRGDLLPGWDEDWLLLERERIRQTQIHALEALARRMCGLGRHLEAIDAALAAIALEPLRESAHGVLIDVFLAEGNLAQARQQFDRYASLLRFELALSPSAELVSRVAAASATPADDTTRRFTERSSNARIKVVVTEEVWRLPQRP
jgi:DNA-binding SARP family transcriptional activator